LIVSIIAVVTDRCCVYICGALALFGSPERIRRNVEQ